MTIQSLTYEGAYFASVIIAVHDDWLPLLGCLEALSAQTDAPPFEIIIVNDGSTEDAPVSFKTPGSIPLKIVSQAHSGISAARNKGIRNSAGTILVFMDADCVPRKDCLASLASFIADSPHDNCFQLHLEGDTSTLAGRIEELRFIATQRFRLQASGHISYLNTSAFAIRSSSIDTSQGLFDERVLRAEDTLLLADLARQLQLPLFVPSATVRHVVNLSAGQMLLKTARSAFEEATAYAIIVNQQMNVRASLCERLHLLGSIWNISKNESIGRKACLLLIVRQSVRFVVLSICRILPGLAVRPSRPEHS
jgi:glycosyltransferase involved in cell wall biosynthesis